MMTQTCASCVSTALDKLKFRSIVVTSQKQQFYGVYNFQSISKRSKRQYDRNAMMRYEYMAVYRVSKWFGSYKLRKFAVFGELPQLIEILAYLTQLMHNLNTFLSL